LRAITHEEEKRVEQIDVNEHQEIACILNRTEIRRHANHTKTREPHPRNAEDSIKLAQVFCHLLVNAAQALDENDAPVQNQVVITSEVEPDAIVITIEDTGQGIPEETRARIFEPFFSTKQRGIGLGLSLSDEIVRAHRGTISAESDGAGTKIRIRLPSDTGLRARMPRAPVEAPTQATAMLRVLVIDDEPLVLKALARALQRTHDVVLADSGRRAIELLSSDRHFDVVLCDLMMPDLDGSDVYEHAKEARPELADKFLFLSGGAYIAKLRTFTEAHKSSVLDKPVTPRALKDALERTAAKSSE
jgi:CheY-like chemotaxis protein/anti-sigma regulatory factor (Ser/Thr protein kinase)